VDPIGDEAEADGPEAAVPVPARSQAYAAVVVVVLVMATVAVAWSMDGSEVEVNRSDWAYDMTQLDAAGELDHRGQGVTVGIVDTGIDPDHPCLRGADVVAWKDLVNDRPAPYDDVGHGSAMASIISGHDPLGGGAKEVELIIVKVMDADHSYSDTVIADGIDFCMDPDGDGNYSDGADIISLSLGGEYDDIDELLGTKTATAIAQAISHGVVVVAAAGNDGTVDDVTLPGRIPSVVSVGAVDRRGQMAPFSSPGNASDPRPDPDRKPEVVAPGVDVVTAYREGRYAKGSGTSQAAAFVTAAVAVAMSAAPQWTHDGARGGNETSVVRIKTALMETAVPVDGQQTPHDPRAGYGVVQALDLILELKG
jgi:subtilisin family serine protease